MFIMFKVPCFAPPDWFFNCYYVILKPLSFQPAKPFLNVVLLFFSIVKLLFFKRFQDVQASPRFLIFPAAEKCYYAQRTLLIFILSS